MTFADFLSPDAIKVPLQARDMEGVIREMVQVLVEADELDPCQYDDVVNRLRKSEELGSTGIGRGVAIPNTSCRGLERLAVALAISPVGIDWGSLDDEPAYMFFMLISPPDRPGDHLRACEYIFHHLRDEGFCSALRRSKTPQEVWQLLEEADRSSGDL